MNGAEYKNLDGKISTLLASVAQTREEIAGIKPILSTLQRSVEDIKDTQELCPARLREIGIDALERSRRRRWERPVAIGGFIVAMLATIPAWIVLMSGCSVLEDSKAGERPSPSPSVRQELQVILTASEAWAERRHGASTNDPDEVASTGDSALFDGLLCFAGVEASCASVKASQTPDGRFWRSPEWVNREYGSGSAFSRDMALGVLAYIKAKNDKVTAELWGHYLRNNGYQLCPDERNCRLESPMIWSTFRHVFDSVGAARFGAMWASEHGHQGLAAQARAVPVGYQLHLVGVHAMLLQSAGIRKPTTTSVLASRQPENPYFAWLNYEPDRAASLALKYCPTSQPSYRQMWQWERELPKPRPELGSGGWDCVFLSRLLLN
jgi:hypothetical protein